MSFSSPSAREQVLAAVPTEDRNRVGLLANYFMNTQGGRPSDAARRAVKEYEAGNLEKWEAVRQAERDEDHRRNCQYGPRVCDRCRSFLVMTRLPPEDSK